MTPKPRNVVFFATPDELRRWFEANHETAEELWVGYHAKRSGKKSITWQELVDVELCFGWIDSVRHPLGPDSSAQRVTPRRKRSVWSTINIRRFEELRALGVVHARGEEAFARREQGRSGMYLYESRAAALDSDTEREFKRHAAAWRFFQAQPPSYRRTAAHWVMSAKRDETRRRRLEKLIATSRAGERLAAFSAPSRRRAPSHAPE